MAPDSVVHARGRLAATCLSLVTLAWAVACLDADRIARPEPPPLVASWPGLVSDPTPPPLPNSTGAPSPPATLASDVAFVSLAPGTLSGGNSATIRNLASGVVVVTPVVDGGFDPVPIGAAVGDSLAIDIHITGTDRVLHFGHTVRPAARPKVVRTDPPPRKRDVPLNTSIVIVFTEPIDPSTLTPEAVRLLRGAEPVAGTLESPDTLHLTARFVPDVQLTPGTSYAVLITDVLDLDGEALGDSVTIEFTTEAAVATALRFTVQPSGMGAGLKLTPAVRVTATDDAGNTVPTFSDTVRLAIGSGPAGATITGAVNVRAVDGVATFADLRLDQSGAGYTLTATADGLVNTTSVPFDVVLRDSSPSQIAFNRLGDGLFVMNPDGSDIRRLTDGSLGMDVGPAWAPDSRRLAFARFTAVDVPDGGTFDIYTVNSDGSELRRVTNDLGGGWWADDLGATWSPDGTQIAFWGGSTDAGTGGVYVVNLDGSGVRLLTDLSYFGFSWQGGDRIAWSPDGTRIVFPDGFGALNVMHADGTGVTRLPHDIGYDYSPSWSPDGTRIAFQRYVSCATTGGVQPCDVTTVHVMLADGSGVTRLTDYTAYWPTWSPDGTKIAFHGRRPGDGDGWDIYTMNADGSDVTRRTFTPGWSADSEYQPAWSRR